MSLEITWTLVRDIGIPHFHSLSGVNLNCKGDNKDNPKCEFNIIIIIIIIINILTLYL